MNKGRFKTLAIATLSAIALAASIAVAQTTTTDKGAQQGQHMGRHGGRGGHKGWGGMRAGGWRQGASGDDPFDVASVAPVRISAIGFFGRVGSIVVFRIAVRKPVGHQEIDYIRRAEAFPER